jgi:stringent starvation protein B
VVPPPSKRACFEGWVARGVFVHLDPRRPGVLVPSHLAHGPQLVLQLELDRRGNNDALAIDDDGVSVTLSFAGAPFACVLPWSAVYAMVAFDGEMTVWPMDMPPDLPPRAPEPSPLAVVRSDAPPPFDVAHGPLSVARRGPPKTRRATPTLVPPDPPPGPGRRGHLRLVKPS